MMRACSRRNPLGWAGCSTSGVSRGSPAWSEQGGRNGDSADAADHSALREGSLPEPYTAVGLIPTVRGVRKREEIQRNLDHLSHVMAAASWLSSLDLPVRCCAPRLRRG